MARKHPYQLLCPIARALDVLGDRWTLLILRDLHAGPARFGELERGLGLAPNLLAQRLGELIEADVVERAESAGHQAYVLTDLGGRTDRVLWELSRFGGALPPETDPREPGNLRTVVLPLRMLLAGVDDRPDLSVRMLIDDESVLVCSDADGVTVSYGESNDRTDLVLATDYSSFLAVGEGRMEPRDFVADHLEVVSGGEHLAAFLGWLGGALEALAQAERNVTSA